MDKLTFKCSFGRGITATLIFDVAKYLEERNPATAQKMTWSKRPDRKIHARYLAWMHTVNAEIAKAINGTYLYIVEVGPAKTDVQRWLYHPDGRRESV